MRRAARHPPLNPVAAPRNRACARLGTEEQRIHLSSRAPSLGRSALSQALRDPLAASAATARLTVAHAVAVTSATGEVATTTTTTPTPTTTTDGAEEGVPSDFAKELAMIADVKASQPDNIGIQCFDLDCKHARTPCASSISEQTPL